MIPDSVNRACCWAWQAGRREGSSSRRHHEHPPASLGLLWGPGNGLSANVFRQQVFPHLFLTAELEMRLLQPPSGTFGLPEPDTTRSPRRPALSCDERIAASTSGGKQSLSELATAPQPSPWPSELHPGCLVGRGFPSGSVTPGSLQGLLCTGTLSSLREHLGTPVLPRGEAEQSSSNPTVLLGGARVPPPFSLLPFSISLSPLKSSKGPKCSPHLGEARMVPGAGESRDRDGQHSSDLPAQGCPDAHGTPRSLGQGRAQGKEEAGRSIRVHGVNPSCATRAARAVPPRLRAIHSSCSPLLALLQSCFLPPCPSPAIPACLLAV